MVIQFGSIVTSSLNCVHHTKIIPHPCNVSYSVMPSFCDSSTVPTSATLDKLTAEIVHTTLQFHELPHCYTSLQKCLQQREKWMLGRG